MNENAYELIALAMRYFFAGLMVLIVLRAGRGALIDSRRAAKLRRLSPSTGIAGELVVVEGDGRIRRGMRYPVIREGVIGSSKKADIQIRHPSVRRRHAYFQLTEKGLRIRGHAGAKIYVAKHTPVREILLGDGGAFAIGQIRLLLVLGDGRNDDDALFEPHSPAVHTSEREADEDVAYDPDAPYRRPQETDVNPNRHSFDAETYEDEEDIRYRRPTETGEDQRYRRPAEPGEDQRYRRTTEPGEDVRYRRPTEPGEDVRYRRPTESGEDVRYRRTPESQADSRYRRDPVESEPVEDDPFDEDDLFEIDEDAEIPGEDAETFPRNYRPARLPASRQRRPKR